MNEERFYDKWNTEVVPVKQSYKPDSYTAEEWKLRKLTENEGCEIHTYSPWVNDLSELDFGL
ncbi:hypothetical protein VPHG_00013 [Vibrio phage 11895-B1]|uniref:hypothetical protein n=1 Tax=Vibrio phage 11895-B1 TaxID=754075 RepID=UPI0002C06132|nr:hypothetical protein VPHG_00013 [Vibrio phage 11895-B1]AGH32080.1 hypothetical protein VPHG_00013 [Vibrio phage 11895-B1]